MKLFVPEPAITLYQDGFDTHDLLDRKVQGKHLSNLVENISDPMVIALDGEWGSGKTVFLKCWVGEHLKETGNQAQTIYFDAFEHDFMNDPLIALIRAIEAEIQDDTTRLRKFTDAAKQAVGPIAITAMRIGAAAWTSGTSEVLSGVAKAALDKATEITDAQLQEHWENHKKRQASLTKFRNQLTKFAQDQKLVIVIDELDRCRPDFALSMLEILKHLFHVPNVHFVLGVNLTALEHSVRARYGAGIDASRYLKKFYHLIFELTDSNPENSPLDQKIRYANKVFTDAGMKIDLEKPSLGLRIMKILQQDKLTRRLSFRDINQIYTNAAITQSNCVDVHYARSPIALLLILKTVDHSLYQRAMNLDYVAEEIFGLFDISPNDLESLKESEYFYQAMKDVIAYFAKTPEDFLEQEDLNNFDYRFLSQKHDWEGARKTSFKEKVLTPLKSFELSNT